MSVKHIYIPDPKRDLILERVVDVPVDLVWEAWTTPEHLKHWFAPRPWQTVDCRLDPRPGGEFTTVMRSPEGEDFPSTGCYLEVIPKQKLAWTEMMDPGFRVKAPSPDALGLTAVLLLEPKGKGTKYTALALHPSEGQRDKHAAMGFQEGWGMALDQLVEWAKLR